MTQKNSNGYVVFEGASAIDGKPIVVIATGFRDSKNRKTGGMIQTWIIRQDIKPSDAVKSDDDISVCGNCPHRKNADGKRSCYVNVGQAPNAVYKCYKRGGYRALNGDMSVFDGRAVRIGSYGDPGAIPADVWVEIIDRAAYHTGYTHRWRDTGAALCGMLQASADNDKDHAEATAAGWKTFQVLPAGKNMSEYKESGKRIVCPATTIEGMTCDKCKLCNGCKANVIIEVHGTGKGNFKG